MKPDQLTEQRPEKLGTGRKIFEFLDRIKFFGARKSDETFNKWLESISYDDYINYITRLNGILRHIPIKERFVDGENVEISLDEEIVGLGVFTPYLPPYPEQKDTLMKEGFKALKIITNNEDRALLIYYLIQTIHPYMDGNGRTGRLLYLIISQHGKNLSQEKLSELLDHDINETGKGRNIFAKEILNPESAIKYINRELAKQILTEDFLKNYKGIEILGVSVRYLPKVFLDKLSNKEVILANKILNEFDGGDFAFYKIVLAKLISERPNLQKYQYISSDPARKTLFCVDGERMAIYDLTEDVIRRIIEIHKDIKRKFIETIIDIFVNPQNHQINKNGENIPIKSVFRTTSEFRSPSQLQ